MPRVSVIIPAWNAAATLARAVASVAAQGDASLEIIIVDDGSTDDTAQVAAALPGTSLRTPHRGPAAARNAALAVAGGDLIGFLDADDLWPPGSVHKLLGALAGAPSADAARGQVQVVVAGPRGDTPWGGPWRTTLLGNALWRRRLVERVGPFDETLRHAEDLEWLGRARDAGLVAVEIDAPTYIYRLHGANSTADVAARNRGIMQVLHRRIKRRMRP